MSADDRPVSAEAQSDPVDVAANRLLGAEGRLDAAEIKLWAMVGDLEKAKQKDDHVAVAEAEVAVAKAEVAVAKAKVDVAEAELRAAKAKLGSTESKLEKAIQSSDPAGIAEAKAAVAEAKAAVAEAKAAVAKQEAAVSEAKVAVAEAEVRAAEGELEKAIQSGDPAGIAKQETKVAEAKAAVAKQEAAQEMVKAALDRAIRGLAIAHDAYERALHAGTGVFAVINRQGEAVPQVQPSYDSTGTGVAGIGGRRVSTALVYIFWLIQLCLAVTTLLLALHRTCLGTALRVAIEPFLLDSTLDVVSGAKPLLFAVHEDWGGGLQQAGVIIIIIVGFCQFCLIFESTGYFGRGTRMQSIRLVLQTIKQRIAGHQGCCGVLYAAFIAIWAVSRSCGEGEHGGIATPAPSPSHDD